MKPLAANPRLLGQPWALSEAGRGQGDGTTHSCTSRARLQATEGPPAITPLSRPVPHQ